MNKEEIMLLLREGLRIQVDKEFSQGLNTCKLRVKLFLYDEEISSDYQIVGDA